jgi:hypothetical protein
MRPCVPVKETYHAYYMAGSVRGVLLHPGHLTSTRNHMQLALSVVESTSYPGSFLLGSKEPCRHWSRDPLKSSRFLINYLGFLYDNHTNANYKLNYQNNPNHVTSVYQGLCTTVACTIMYGEFNIFQNASF